MKNIKKAEQKKRRALGRRASEGDAEHMAAGSWTSASKKSSQQTDEDDDDDDYSQTDSGLASSVEEASMMSKRVAPTAKSKLAKQTKKKAPGGNFLKEANPDLIFDLDF